MGFDTKYLPVIFSRAAFDCTDPEHMEASSFSVLIIPLLQLTEGRNQAPNLKTSEISGIGQSQTPPLAVHPFGKSLED